MGKDHKEAILTLLERWRSLLGEQEKSLSEGTLKVLEKLVRDSAAIQARLNGILSETGPDRLDRRCLDLVAEIRDRQAALIKELETGSQEILATLGRLRKNRASLAGYRQKGVTGPRFMNERT
ncbi:MAG: hypothetical protein WAR22_07360 [Desulfomonilia bacterium]|jgi:hypothetical protein